MFFAHAAAAAIKLAGFAASGQESCWCFVRPWFGLLFPVGRDLIHATRVIDKVN
jgi:hypothetical protein